MSDMYDQNSMYRELVGYEEDNEDAQFLKSMYSTDIMGMQLQVEEIMDMLEYNGSIIFDQYPDKVRIMKIADDMGLDKEKRQLMEVLIINEMLRRRIRRRYCRARGFC
ncbi:MAG: hypothetical protein IJV71_10685 [Lachnospiraceae bacterium]|nr:hypothetical protein [Lachnospiraceae bacterium]